MPELEFTGWPIAQIAVLSSLMGRVFVLVAGKHGEAARPERRPWIRWTAPEKFTGPGFFLATLTGPGHVVIQSMTLQKLRANWRRGRTGGDEHSTLGALGGIFGSED